MPFFEITHADKPPTHIDAAALVVHEGYLHATSYSGAFEPGRSEAHASWAPGAWVSFQRAPKCPTCEQQIRSW